MQAIHTETNALTIPDLLAERAATDPGRVAMQVIGYDALTFGGWHRRSTSAARHLRDLGIEPGDRVGLIFDNRHWTDFAVAYCATQRAGAVPVPFSRDATAAELEHALTSCGASLAMYTSARPAVPGIREIAFADLDHDDDDLPRVPARPDDLAQILYTSGTAGKPKGIGASHQNLTFGCRLSPRFRPFEHSTRFIHAFPIGTSAGQAMLLNAIVTHPSALILEHFDAEQFCGAIERFSVGTVFIVPTMAIDLVNSKAYEKHDLSSVIVAASSGSALPQSVALSLTEIFPNATVFNSYTSTEAMPAQVLLMIDPDEPQSAGVVVGNVGIRIADEDGSQLPAGQVGAVWLRCPAAPRFYYSAPEETARVFRDGWVRMGDFGYLDDHGRLYLVDRESDVVNSGAMRISTTEVERALCEHEQVADAAVFGVPHPVMGSMIAAAVVLDDHGSLPDVRSFLRQRLAPHKVPLRWLVVEALPRNQMGKIKKPELRERLQSQRSAPAGG